jgi:hypothetical protein
MSNAAADAPNADSNPYTHLDDYKHLSEAELVSILMSLPDAHNYPLPAKLYKKYGIKPAEAVSFRDYAESQIWLKRQYEEKQLPPLEIKPEDLPAEVLPYVEVAPPKVEVETKTTDAVAEINTIQDGPSCS